MTPLFAVMLSLAEPADDGSAPAEALAVEHKELEAVLLRTEAVDGEALRAALKLRVPGTQVAPLSEVSELPGDAPYVFADIKFIETDGVFELTLIVSDGRAYDRLVHPDEGASPEETADRLSRDIANLLLGIEEGSLAPDRSDVPIPEPPAPAHGPEPEPEPEEAASIAPVETTPSRPPSDRPPPPWLELGVRVAPSVAIGLGEPAEVNRLAAGGGTLGLGARFERGPVVLIEARLAGRSHTGGNGLLRTRVGLGGGYSWRPNRDASFELEAIAMVTAEPWLVLADGSRASLGRASVPAVGGLVRLTPAFRWSKPDESLGVRFGPSFEYSLSALPGEGGGVAKISSPTDDGLDPMFRLGGSELSFGLDFVLYFDFAARRSPPLYVP